MLDPQDQPTRSHAHPSNAEQEALTVLASCLDQNPLPAAPDELDEEQIGVYRTESSAAKHLHCLALVRDGKITPYIDLNKIPEPQTAGEKMTYLAYIARTILDNLMDTFMTAEERRRQHLDQQDGEERGEGGCYA